MPLEDLKQNCIASLEKIVGCLKNFCESVQTAATHISNISRESSTFQFVEAFDHGKIPSLREIPDAKVSLLEKIKDIIDAELMDLELIRMDLKADQKNIVTECVNVMNCIKKAALSSEELNYPVFGCDSIVSVIEDVRSLEKLIENEYLWRQYELYSIHGDFTKVNDETVSKWKETRKLTDLQKDLEKISYSLSGTCVN